MKPERIVSAKAIDDNTLMVKFTNLEKAEIIITGRCKHQPAYFDLATVHSEMICHKHYAARGVDLKRGVDF